ncbi:MAG: bifunctional glutamate N-acetyltransferase/amino-acid acetyltransferase ArgJ [bacterium]|nr:bifunctional glutamate N-acetyltransferase/amino-acid acetyltransferase ArgJ [bacterium]
MIEEIQGGGITSVPGIKASGVHCGIKKEGLDLALIYSSTPSHFACMYTTNRIKGAHILVNKRRKGKIQAVVINSGNANCCTGRRGIDDAERMAVLTAERLNISPSAVLVASTGIIGVPLPMDKIERGIDEAVKKLSEEGGIRASQAILTTDTRPKQFAIRYSMNGERLVIGGIAKGAGMIHPRLGTMLAFIATNAAISSQSLRIYLKKSVDNSFNLITVDGDTSPNDLVVLLANGNLKMGQDIPYHKKFQEALDYVTHHLAKMIVEDGEGATKLIVIHVKGARSMSDAKRVAFSIGKSNLVKSAIYGCSPNWGRIITASGGAGVNIKQDKIDIYLGGEMVCKDGCMVNFDLVKVREILQKKEVLLTVDLKLGSSEARVLTPDLSPEYVKINAP